MSTFGDFLDKYLDKNLISKEILSGDLKSMEIDSENRTLFMEVSFLSLVRQLDLFKIEKGFFKNKYTANFVYELEDQSSNKYYDISAYTSTISMQYKVTLPEKALKNNATSVSDDGLTYTWKAPYGEITNISYTFEVPNILSYVMCIVGGIIVAGAIFSVIIIKAKKSKKSDTKKEPKKEKK